MWTSRNLMDRECSRTHLRGPRAKLYREHEPSQTASRRILSPHRQPFLAARMRVRSFGFPGATRRGHPATVMLTQPPISEIVLHNVRTRKGKNAVSRTSRAPLRPECARCLGPHLEETFGKLRSSRHLQGRTAWVALCYPRKLME